MNKKAIISVTSDLVTDQRVHRTAMAFCELGFSVLLVGRKLKSSLPVDKAYQTKRFNLFFEKGFLFYAEYNLRLFVFLLFSRSDLLFANDLDTLLPNYLISKIKNKKLIYDSHEYFTGVPELENRPLIKSVWKKIEQFIFPKLKNSITVNDSIAQLYFDEYKKTVNVIRNVPLSNQFIKIADKNKFRTENNLPADKKIIILQGSGINIHRGAEEAVEAMQFLNDYVLLIIGGGDVFESLKNSIQKLSLSGKVILKNKMPYHELMNYTQCADLGLTIDKDTNINYRFSLPNKLFDYLHAGIPVLASDLPEIRKIVEQYNVGKIIPEVTPQEIAKNIQQIFLDEKEYLQMKLNTAKAAQELNWDIEKQKLFEIINTALTN